MHVCVYVCVCACICWFVSNYCFLPPKRIQGKTRKNKTIFQAAALAKLFNYIAQFARGSQRFAVQVLKGIGRGKLWRGSAKNSVRVGTVTGCTCVCVNTKKGKGKLFKYCELFIRNQIKATK